MADNPNEFLTEQQKDEKDAFARGVKSQKKVTKLALILSSILTLGLGGVGGALIYKAVRDKSESELISDKLLEIYSYLKNDWLYTGTFEDFKTTFENYMIQSTLDSLNSETDNYLIYTDTFAEQNLTTDGSKAFGYSGTYGVGTETASGKTYGGMKILQVYHGNFETAGFKKGDLLIAVKKDTDTEYTYVEDIPPLNIKSKMESANEGAQTSFKVLRDGAVMELSASLGDYSKDAVTFISDEQVSGKHVLALNVQTFLGTGTNSVDNLIKSYVTSSLSTGNIDELVLDCRDNGGGYTNTAALAACLFLPKGSIVYSEGDNDGNLSMTYYQGSDPAFSSEQVKDIRIILNYRSASATELFTKALAENGRATTYGQTSYGKGIEQAVITLKSGGYLRLTTRKVYGPKGTTFEGVGVKGIVPDVATNDYYTSLNYGVATPYVEDSYRLTYAQENKIVQGLQSLGAPYSALTTYEALINQLQTEYGMSQTGEYDTHTLYRYYQKVIWPYFVGFDKEVNTVINHE